MILLNDKLMMTKREMLKKKISMIRIRMMMSLPVMILVLVMMRGVDLRLLLAVIVRGLRLHHVVQARAVSRPKGFVLHRICLT